MFTGIIEEVGTLVDRKVHGSSLRLQIEAEKVLTDLKIDDSISIDGCCQTVIEVKPSVFEVISVQETLQKTTLGSWKVGASVNLERAATLSTRLGGHLVQGHIDSRARVSKIVPKDGSWEFFFEIPTRLMKYAVPVGSVTINGVSLTIAECGETWIKTAIIPHTFEKTNFQHLRPSDEVNLEMDAIAKMVEKFVAASAARIENP